MDTVQLGHKLLTAREAAFFAYGSALAERGFMESSLEKWKEKCSPKECDVRLAQEIAYGTCRRQKTLDYYLSKYCELPRKKKEKALLRQALYQMVYMDRVPAYAIVDAACQIAKKHVSRPFSGFLNALLRRIDVKSLSLPTGNSLEEISIRTSFPTFLVEQVTEAFGKERAEELLRCQNEVFLPQARCRGEDPLTQELLLLEKKHYLIPKRALLQRVADSSSFYIQNRTPAFLMEMLVGCLEKPPKTVLDLTASPGGKLLLAYDLLEGASFVANDVSGEKRSRLEQNCQKYGIECEVTEHLGQEYPLERQFDLLLLDAPCSNTGVLHKRPEARWRVSESSLAAHVALQTALLERGAKLLAPGGVIFYMTCSILPEENEKLLARVCKTLGLVCVQKRLILPDEKGLDGGFGAFLQLQ